MGFYWIWLGVAAIFAIIEFCTITFFGLWMAIAALVPAIISYLFPHLSVVLQLLTWAISSLICAFIWVKWIRSKPVEYIDSSLLGAEGILADALQPGKMGILLLSRPIQGKQEWSCFSDDILDRQTRVIVTDVTDSSRVKVEASSLTKEGTK
ncbi:NfeD family protein [Rosenbergiella collisarenosi]|uniref:NfeD family protein n=1 Tax=Rosenbergiella collisarenosi TaxID=1544695 RepID=UPI001F4F57A3|nr:NfeD family protein [Rosenbergiella collisarenosi]